MKPFLALITLLFSAAASAQNDKSLHFEIVPKYPLYRQNPLQEKFLFLNKFPASSFPTVHLPFPGVTVYLTQDHMPCFVPQAATIALITNFWSSKLQPTSGLIPNPATPININALLENRLAEYRAIK